MNREPRFRHCYLHIGLGKTGTTSVQQAFAREADALESQYDLHFPHVFPDRRKFNGNHSLYLRPLFCEFPRARRRLAAMGLETDEQIAAYNSATTAALEQGFAATDAQQLLLSAEVITHFQPEDLRGLAHWAGTLADTVTVVACIRHPAHALASEIQQRLRIGARLENLYANPPSHPLREKFSLLEEYFGRDRVIAYSFHRAIEHPSGLAAALLKRIGIHAQSLFQPERAANTSMSREAALALSAYNERTPAFILGKANPERSRAEVRRLAAIPGERFHAPEATLARVIEQTGEDIRWMEQHYGIDLTYARPT